MARGRNSFLDPDDIFLDSSNLANLDTSQFEGRVEKPVSSKALIAIAAIFILSICAYTYRAFDLQILRGSYFESIAKENRLAHSLIFAERSVMYDRTGKELAWNEEGKDEAPRRAYTALPGLSHVLGYVQYPKKDAQGLWWRTEYLGIAGAEKTFNAELAGVNGKRMVEVNAHGELTRESLIDNPRKGSPVTLSIDADVQSALFTRLATHARENRFEGGASVIMDVRSGEVLALVSFPEFSSQFLSDGSATATARYNENPQKPFLDRAIAGTYIPGSIVKPFFAVAALAEKTIAPEKSVYSPGYITIPNPYDKEKPTIMKDWKAHGWVNMRQALAASSDVYFYALGGGYEDQKGLGIGKLDEYAKLFGIGEISNIPLEGEVAGVIPTPEWKRATFDGEDWRLGDTYNTAIGQYGFQVTPIQMARATAALANGGFLLTPQLIASSSPQGRNLGLSEGYFTVVHEGMEAAVESDIGTARALNITDLAIAAKTGTAEIGSKKQYMNSWVIGFWPRENPRYAFATVLEKAPAGTLSGAAPAMRPFFEWLVREKIQYIE